MIDKQSSSIITSVVRKHLPDPSYHVFIFGSRTKNTHRKFSDVDIGISGPSPVPAVILVDIEEDLQKSDLPHMTNVVDFSQVSDNFKNHALQSTITI